MPRLSTQLAALAIALPLGLGLAGCGGAGTSADTGGPAAQKTQSPARGQDKDKEKDKDGRRPADTLVTPDTKIDPSKADPVVKGEVEGGESKKPTPMEYLVQEPDEALIQDEPYAINKPEGLPPVEPYIPASNPMTKGRVELGKQLYFDPRVSKDGTVSCASCHNPEKGWTDNAPSSTGIGGQVGGRSSPTVLNTLYGRVMFWDGRAPSLEGQAQGPIQNKIEMGDQSYKEIVERLRGISGYREQFRKVFGTDVTLDGMAKAIAAFERTALSGNSRYDKYAAGNQDDPETFKHLSESEKRGMVLFGLRQLDDDPFRVDASLLKKANCTDCHAGSNFSDDMFHNLGVGYDGKTRELADLGRYEISPIGAKYKAEKGAFKTPTIRDIARTAPYMHDGSEKTLEQVVEFYDKGGIENPTLDPKMKPLKLTQQEKADLVAFMKALTGEVVAVPLPTLPAGPDGKSPDPSKAIGMGPANTANAIRDAHKVFVAR